MSTPYYPSDPPTGPYASPDDPLRTPPLGQYATGPHPTGPRTTAPLAALPATRRRRLALLAATLYMPVIALGYVLYLYGPTQCVVGPFCTLIDAPGIVQFLLLGLAFGALYVLTARLLTHLLDGARPARSEVERALRQAARFETLRPLLGVFGAIITVTLLWSTFARLLTLPAFLFGGVVAALFFWLALAAEP